MLKTDAYDTGANEKWDAQLRKGSLELAILATLNAAPLYGLAILKRLHSRETLQISEGTLYPLLDRLKREGDITSNWVQEGDARPRKYFELTTAGRKKLSDLTCRWHRSVTDMNSLLNDELNQEE